MNAFTTHEILSIPDLSLIDNILKDRNLSFQFIQNQNHVGSNQQSAEESIFNSAYVQKNNAVKIRHPRPKPPEILAYKLEQDYEAEVIAINLEDSTFTARLIDMTNNGPDEEGEFSLKELNGDESLVVPGALFTWKIGLQTRGSRDLRASDIRFRRIPPFSKEVIAKAEHKAQLLSKFFNENTSTEPFELHI